MLNNKTGKITWPEVTLSSSVVVAPLSSAELIPVGKPTYRYRYIFIFSRKGTQWVGNPT